MSNVIFAYTGISQKVTHLTWKLDNFLGERLWRKESTVTGPDITIPTQPPTIWNSAIDRKEMSVSDGFLFLFRCQPLEHRELKKECQIEFEVSFKDVTGNCIRKYQGVAENGIRVKFASSNFNLNPHKNIFELLVNNDLILNCCFKVVQRFTGCLMKAEVSPEYDLDCLVDNFKGLYESKNFSDFTIVVNDTRFSVHKCILASRSTVFAAMFKSHTLESIKNKLVVKDFDTKTMELFILYIYTGQLKDDLSVEQYCQLYSISDKYEVVSLNKTCGHILINCISVDNVCDIYALAYYHNDITLNSAAKFYMSKNLSSVLTGENWRKITSQNNDVASAILKEFGMT